MASGLIDEERMNGDRMYQQQKYREVDPTFLPDTYADDDDD